MVFASWRGVVGVVKPTHRPGSLEEFIRLLPEGIGVVPVYLNFQRGTEDEFRAALNAVHEKVGELAKEGVDLIHPEGAPPFMLLGYQKEQELISGWEKKYGVQMFTSGQNHVHALRTLGVRKFVGATYFPEKMNNIFARYFNDAGFQVLAMEGIDAPFAAVPSVPPEEILEFMKRIAAKHKDADGIYMLGSAWKTVAIVDQLEKQTGLTVVHAGPARAWETQLRLGLHHKIPGYGRLLAEMPG
jgi:maleate cis-trans isomerase